VEIAPGIFAESVVKRAHTPSAEPYEVYRVTGGVFDHFELDSMASLVHLIGILSTFEEDELRSLGEEPFAGDDDRVVRQVFAGRRAERFSALDRGHRRAELELPAIAPPAAAHRRFACDAGAPRRARIWAAETLGDCLPDTDWSVALLEQTVLQASELVGEAVEAGASAVLVTLEITDRRLALTRFDEFPGSGQALA
jgi:hypothetical protein